MVLDSPIEYLKGVGPARAELFRKELGVFTFEDLLMQFPFRHVDRSTFHRIADLTPDSGDVQLRGILRRIETVGGGAKKRVVAKLRDDTGVMELVWFKGVNWIQDSLEVGKEYVVFGRVTAYGAGLNIAHPEMEEYDPEKSKTAPALLPVYSSTEKLNSRGLDVRARRRLLIELFQKLQPADLPENLPDYLLEKLRLPPRAAAIRAIHFPKNQEELEAARKRLKFEELFLLQLRLLQLKNGRHASTKGYVFEQVGEFFNRYYQEKIPFELTDAQKRVIKEIRRDLGLGIQMNRLLQGDVGSGKTMVAMLCMLIALDNGYQASLMAPTEILAQQHYQTISEHLESLGVRVGFLTGNVKGKARKAVLEQLESGEMHIVIGTHALLEDWVQFQNLGLAITDEQHRFGVEQRARLWNKSKPLPPHVLVMTATPIPRTLAMTLYGDLDVSVIDELPPGRKPITTMHRTDSHRLRVFGFMKEQIALGRQIYVVYPLIEESEKLDLKNLEEGYEAITRAFPPPEYQVSILHGRMKPADKDFEMGRFVRGETQIMVATTVIEVGVNVPNASVMVIENTERFGLSQLHQLRGRVGRGADQSYCILMSDYKLSREGRQRIETMCRTNNGFDIAEADLQLRGPGDLEGTQQSGVLNLKIADLAKDGRILQAARDIAQRVLDKDPQLQQPHHAALKGYLAVQRNALKGWGRIS
ncbi:MAG: ATP-dependent DNA helicase RecG [Saprospiraceae bacterium]